MENELKYRIFNTLPSGSYNMGRLLDLIDIVESDSVSSASIECAHRPRMFINPGFVQEYCQRDEHLFLLVMHELYHVILGHTRLFERPTKAHNIIFDAIINSMLCHEFPDREYVSFFEELNPWNTFPGRLLRPPPDWPTPYTYIMNQIPVAQRKVIEILYGKNHNTATYHDVWEALLEDQDFINTLVSNSKPEAILIGNHEGDDHDPARSGMLRDVIREIIETWPPPKVKIAGRDQGIPQSDFFLESASTPKGQFMIILKRLLKKAGIYSPSQQGPKRVHIDTVQSSFLSPIPAVRDRRVAAHKLIYGRPPLFYQSISNIQRPVFKPSEVAHVYLDISGSMMKEAQIFCAALKPFHRRGEVKVHVFSTVVDVADPTKPLDQQNLQNTMGTDIQCVIDHILAYQKKDTPRRVLLFTDGYTGIPNAQSWKEIQDRKIEIYAGLTEFGLNEDLVQYLTHYETIPTLTAN